MTVGSETAWIWGLAVAVTAAIVLSHVWRFHRRARQQEADKAEAARLGIDQPTAQYPFVDAERCIGCGACVAACPEGDVLGVVAGTAVVINGLRCVGHGRCEEACPVGAIEVGLGDLRARSDVPLLRPTHESSVPGVYVVGELGGLALVRNAIAQGRGAVEAIATRQIDQTQAPPGGVDIAIVGAGPSGLSAALAAHRAGLSCVVLEREATLGGSLLHYPRRKMVLTQPVELPLGGRLDREEYQKEALLELFEAVIEDVGLDLRFGSPVTGIEGELGAFRVLAGDATLSARFVVLALGRRGAPRKLGIPGEELSKVMYRLIDAASYRDRDLLVVGGGDSAAEAALGLASQPGNRVTLSYRREKIVRVKHKNQEKLDRAFADGSIQPLFRSNPIRIEPEAVRLAVEGGGEVELANDEVFVFAGGVPPFGLLRDLGIEFGG